MPGALFKKEKKKTSCFRTGTLLSFTLLKFLRHPLQSCRDVKPSQDTPIIFFSELMGWPESYERLAVRHITIWKLCSKWSLTLVVPFCFFVLSRLHNLECFPIESHIPLWCFTLRLGLFVTNSQSGVDGNVFHLWWDWGFHSAAPTASKHILSGLHKGNESANNPLFLHYIFCIHTPRRDVLVHRTWIVGSVAESL